MEAETVSLKVGDVYRWAYRQGGDDREWGRYHCCSRIAIVEPNGRLRDTFWSYGGDGRSFGAHDLPKLELTFLANLGDLEKAKEWQADYYDDADIVNLNHSNSSRDNFYLRKGATRSTKKMLAVARRKLEEALSEQRRARDSETRFREAIALIESGATDVHL